MDSIGTPTPRQTARMIGFFYLLYCALSGIAMYARSALIVAGDAGATATNIIAHPSLYSFAFACDTIGIMSNLAVTALLYALLTPVSANGSTVFAFFGLMGGIVQGGVAGVFQLAPLALLGGAKYLGAFTPEQLHAQAYFSLRLYNQGYSIALVCFAFFDLVVGYLVCKSTFMPRILGALMMVAGASFLTFLVPAFGSRYLAWMLPLGVGELLVMLWLLVKGVDAERWTAQARESVAWVQRESLAQ